LPFHERVHYGKFYGDWLRKARDGIFNATKPLDQVNALYLYSQALDRLLEATEKQAHKDPEIAKIRQEMQQNLQAPLEGYIVRIKDAAKGARARPTIIMKP
ncbi:MAG: hypothetical protein KGQ41_09365, partial [Alphaproteobacteria bacterium]|nr:hypothetical protein [Alphaproteobacteria bacterium]